MLYKKQSCLADGPNKKHKEILKDKFPDYEIVWNSSVEPARKGYAGTMFLYKNNLTPSVTYPSNRSTWYHGC